MTKLLICEDSRLLADALAELISRRPNYEVTEIVGSAEKLLESLKREEADLVLLDLFLPDMTGIDVMKLINEAHPEVRVLGFSSYQDPQVVKEFLLAGAVGFVSKNASSEELLRSIDASIEGHKVLPTELSNLFLNKVPQSSSLSPRELSVLQLIAGGLSTIEVAAKLNISPKTVETHRLKIMAKMGTNSIADLTKIAVRLGLSQL